jgi:hypothetical protein
VVQYIGSQAFQSWGKPSVVMHISNKKSTAITSAKGKEDATAIISLTEVLEKKERKVTRDETLAIFQFYRDDRSSDNFEGVTMNISRLGFCFCTQKALNEGQTLTVTRMIKKSTMPDFAGQQAKVLWAKERPNYIEAGAELIRRVNLTVAKNTLNRQSDMLKNGHSWRLCRVRYPGKEFFLD